MSSMQHWARRCLPRRWRNWLRAPGQTARWLADGARFALGRRDRVAIRPGWDVVCHPAALRLAYAAHLRDPEQARELDAFIARCRPGMRLWDVGAHFGLFSLAALHYGGAAGEALAIDPSTTAMRMLAVQARLNGVQHRLKALQALVSDRPGRQPIVEAGVIAAGYCLPPGADHTPREWSWVEATTLDRLVAERGAHPTHLKIDVEGAEASVLRGGQALLGRSDAPVLFVELHHELVRRGGGDPAAALGLLARLGYRVLATDGQPLAAPAVLARGLVRVVAEKPCPP